MKILLAIACFMMLAGVGGIVLGEIGNAIVPLLLGGFYAAYFSLSPRLSVRKQMKAWAYLSQEGRYEFGRDRFSIDRPSLNVSIPWSDVDSVVELPDAFAIFTTKISFFAVPKRFFDSDQLAAFRALMQSTSGKNGKPLCS
jgi:hypothetical protein